VHGLIALSLQRGQKFGEPELTGPAVFIRLVLEARAFEVFH
jgi:hypothetical protein